VKLNEFQSYKQELVYLIETKNEEKLWNFYTGACSDSPPYFDIILQDVMRLEAVLTLNRGAFGGNEDLFRGVFNYEPGAMIEVLHQASNTNQPYENTYRYLLKNRLSYIVRHAEYERKQDSGLVHSPTWQVW
jgi:hypothetical protein